MREYCCPKCGLIWINTEKEVCCPECKTKKYELYAVDTFGFFYASEGIKTDLKNRGREIHYHKDHPWFNKNSVLSKEDK